MFEPAVADPHAYPLTCAFVVFAELDIFRVVRSLVVAGLIPPRVDHCCLSISNSLSFVAARVRAEEIIERLWGKTSAWIQITA